MKIFSLEVDNILNYEIDANHILENDQQLPWKKKNKTKHNKITSIKSDQNLILFWMIENVIETIESY